MAVAGAVLDSAGVTHAAATPLYPDLAVLPPREDATLGEVEVDGRGVRLLDDATRLERLAAVVQQTPAQFRERFGYLVK